MKTNSVSIVIVTFNCEDHIANCIDSCLNYPVSSIIVVDNNSQDGTASILESYGGKITFLRENVNHGFSKACNIGISKSDSEYIFLLNPDTELVNDPIPKLVQVLEEESQVGAVAPQLVDPDGRIQKYTRTFPTICGLAVESFVPKQYWEKFSCYRKYQCIDMNYGEARVVEQPAAAAIMIRNKYLLDEEYFIYGSDVQLCREIIDAGYIIKQIPTATVMHHRSKGGTGTSDSLFKMYLSLDNYYAMQSYFLRHSTRQKYFRYKVVFTIGLLLSIFISVLPGFGQPKIKIMRFIYFLKKKTFRDFI